MSKITDSLLNPKNWVLKGKAKAIFWAKRKYSGEELDRVLSTIEHGSSSIGEKLAHNDIDLKYGKVNAQDHEKNRANILNQPFVTVIKTHMNPEKPSDGFFELDWNEQFIEQLVQAGYSGDSQEIIVKQWFDQICANVARENGAIFPDEIEEFRHKTARRVKSLDGKTEVL